VDVVSAKEAEPRQAACEVLSEPAVGGGKAARRLFIGSRNVTDGDEVTVASPVLLGHGRVGGRNA
jgi:hypothetical protein